MFKVILIIIGMCIVLPILSFFCIKFGTYGFYKAKRLAEKKAKE